MKITLRLAVVTLLSLGLLPARLWADDDGMSSLQGAFAGVADEAQRAMAAMSQQADLAAQARRTEELSRSSAERMKKILAACTPDGKSDMTVRDVYEVLPGNTFRSLGTFRIHVAGSSVQLESYSRKNHLEFMDGYLFYTDNWTPVKEEEQVAKVLTAMEHGLKPTAVKTCE